MLNIDGNVLFEHTLEHSFNCDSRYFYHWNECIFYITSNNKEQRIVGLDTVTGNELCSIDGRVAGYFDQVEGRVIYLNSRGRDRNGNNVMLPYGIVNLRNFNYQEGVINTQFELNHISTNHKVGRTVGQNRLYFANNRYYDPSQIGMLNLDTMQIESLISVPEKTGVTIMNMIFNNDKLFVHLSTNKLYVYQP